MEEKVKPVKIEAEAIPFKKPMEILFEVAHFPTFPFLVLKFVKSPTVETFHQEIKVKPQLYERILKVYGTDEVIVYFDIPRGGMSAWTKDMHLAITLLNKIGVMMHPRNWVAEARRFISGVIARQSVVKFQELRKIAEEQRKAFDKLKEILKYAGILDQVNQKDILFKIAQDVAKSGVKDLDSMIYRMAMAIYHSESYLGKSIIEALNDPGNIYFNLIGNKEFAEKYKEIVDTFDSLEIPERTSTMKTFISFLIGSYICYKALIQGD